MCRAPVGGMPNARAAATTCWRGSAAMRNRRAVTTPSDLDAFAHDHMFLGAAHDANARRTRWVVLLTAVMMVGEIAAGYVTGSMALLADGFHMATHAGALSRSEEHTSELQSLMRISYAVFCLTKNNSKKFHKPRIG